MELPKERNSLAEKLHNISGVLKKQGGDGGIIEIRQNEKGGELSSKGTELTHISVIQYNRKKYVPAQSVGLTLWGKKKKKARWSESLSRQKHAWICLSRRL